MMKEVNALMNVKEINSVILSYQAMMEMSKEMTKMGMINVYHL